MGDNAEIKPTIRNIMQKWQSRLMLYDWDIEILYQDRHIVETDYGRCKYNKHLKNATIELVRPEQRKCIEFKNEWEEYTILHELLHLKFWYFDNETVGENLVLFEQSLNSLVRTLLEAER